MSNDTNFFSNDKLNLEFRARLTPVGRNGLPQVKGIHMTHSTLRLSVTAVRRSNLIALANVAVAMFYDNDREGCIIGQADRSYLVSLAAVIFEKNFGQIFTDADWEEMGDHFALTVEDCCQSYTSGSGIFPTEDALLAMVAEGISRYLREIGNFSTLVVVC